VFNYLLIIFLAIYLLSLSVRLKKQIYMLQLNSNRNTRYLHWLKRNLIKVFSLKDLLFIIPFVALIFISNKLSLILFILIILLTIFLNKNNEIKQKLVYTQRIKRLLFTIAFLIFLIFTIFYLLIIATNFILFIMILFLILINPYTLVLIANLINKPLEYFITDYYHRDARKIISSMPFLKVIGITGSFGKTSTKYILSKILIKKYDVLMTPGNYNTTLGVIRTIRQYLKPTNNMFICEMGAKQKGDIKEICDLVRPSIGILTSIGEMHLENFKTMENIMSTKNELLMSLPDSGIGIINMDNEYIKKLPRKNGVKYISYGIYSDNLDFLANNIVLSTKGTSFDIIYKEISTNFTTKLLGEHNIYNILAGVCAGVELGVSLEAMVLSIKDLEPIPHRLQLKKNSIGLTIIDDAYNSNPVGSKMALEVLKYMKASKRILLTPGMIELGEKEYELNKQFGVEAAGSCDYVILVGKKQTLPILEGLKEASFSEDLIYVAANLQEAFKKALSIGDKDSVILLENDLTDDYNE